jgi:hypothetical protein
MAEDELDRKLREASFRVLKGEEARKHAVVLVGGPAFVAYAKKLAEKQRERKSTDGREYRTPPGVA